MLPTAINIEKRIESNVQHIYHFFRKTINKAAMVPVIPETQARVLDCSQWQDKQYHPI